MSDLEKYIKENLQDEVSQIQSSDRRFVLNQLNAYEKAIIYHYSDVGFEEINELLRKSKGRNFNEFGKHLNIVLNKLHDFEGLVYRGAHLNKNELNRYLKAFKENKIITEYSFISTTKSRLIAMSFKGNVLFRMFSRTGKDIEKIAKFGISGYPNEREILFNSNRKFRILDIKKESDFTLITLEEIL